MMCHRTLAEVLKMPKCDNSTAVEWRASVG
jgi:hypothetical protein